MTVAEVESWLDRRFIAAPGAALRREDRKKAVELTALLGEIERILPDGADGIVVDVASGKGYVGLLVAELRQRAQVVFIEREERRLEAARVAATAAGTAGRCRFLAGDAADGWPEEPALAIGLHACGPAADKIIDAATGARARHILMVPCCTPGDGPWVGLADELGLPRQAEIRRPFLETLLAAERTLRLEAAGYVTEVVAFVPKSVTPYNLLWRARRVGEPRRAAAAADRLARLRSR